MVADWMPQVTLEKRLEGEGEKKNLVVFKDKGFVIGNPANMYAHLLALYRKAAMGEPDFYGRVILAIAAFGPGGAKKVSLAMGAPQKHIEEIYDRLDRRGYFDDRQKAVIFQQHGIDEIAELVKAASIIASDMESYYEQ